MINPKQKTKMGSKKSYLFIGIISVAIIGLVVIGQILTNNNPSTKAYLVGVLIKTGQPDTYVLTDTVTDPVIHKGNQTSFNLKTGFSATQGNIVTDQNGTIQTGDKLKMLIAEAQPICISQPVYQNGSAMTPDNVGNQTYTFIPKTNPLCKEARIQQIVQWQKIG